MTASILSFSISVSLGSLLLGACAAGAVAVERDPAPGTRVQLDLAVRPSADASRAFPAIVHANLPSADRSARQIRHELGETASVEVRLCVAASGHVDSIAITRGSNLPAFDASVIADAQRWRFAASPGPSELRTCERATITYRPRA